MSSARPLTAPDELTPGISLVTCSMNRNGNLIRALPSWLAHPEVSEIIIVDWSSGMAVAQDLARAGISDARIRIARVYDEKQWILSYAFNIGFRLAQFDQVLKCDADIVLDPEYFAQNRLEQGRFIAGNWRNAGQGQQFVNGFFHVHTTDLMAVNGFNEYITTYGWDDDDLYERLGQNGTGRQDVAPGTVSHLDHEDIARLGGRGVERQNAWSDLDETPMFKIRTNRMIATIMPRWTSDRPMRPYNASPAQDGTLTVRRGRGTPHEVPDHITAKAKRLAACELVSWQAGIRAYALEDERFDLMLSAHRLKTITPLMVELALSDASTAAMTMPRALVADLTRDAFEAAPDILAEAGARLARMAYRSGRLLVVRGPGALRPASLSGPLADAPYMPDYLNLGDQRDVHPDDVRRDGTSLILRLHLDAGGLQHLPETPEVVSERAADWVRLSLPPAAHPVFEAAAPAVQTGRRARLFIDAQHGLGNRLRAIGSGAAVARATGRDLVVVWEPDHHCQGRLADLFDYDGAVEEQSFLTRAVQDGATVLNYMEIEPGATKDAPLELHEGRDAYVRSAYIVNHPASGWEADNLLLQELRPVQAVRDLLERAGEAADIGLHVRMEGAPGTDQNSYDARENWTEDGHAAIHHWRELSHYKHFIARLDVLLEKQPEARVFLAADQAQTYAAFKETYGDRISMIERDLYDRSAEQLRYALADILGLARVRHLLGSNWSSFTETALRLSRSITDHEVSGRDF
jgi:hypothetical protein